MRIILKNRFKRGICIMIVVSMLFGLSACQAEEENDSLSEISEVLDIDMDGGEIVTGSDSHGGFHGDGTAIFEIKFSTTDVQSRIEGNEKWNNLPLTDNLTALIYGLETDEGSFGPLLQGEDNESIIPEVANGYYIFIDRHSQSTNPQDDSEVVDRHSYNFTIAIFDTDTQTLYYMELDT